MALQVNPAQPGEVTQAGPVEAHVASLRAASLPTHPAEPGSYQVAGTALTLTFDEVDGTVTVATGTLGVGLLTITKRVTTAFNGSSTDPTWLEFERIS